MSIESDIIHADHEHLLHPLYHPSAHKTPIVWVEGRGAIVKDITGKEYIDGLSGLWNVNVGHGREELAEAAAAQMRQLAFYSGYVGSTNLPAIHLAEKLSELFYPSINTFFFTSGGAESTETSFKTARFYWKAVGKPEKVKFIARMKGYHGVTMAAMAATGLPAYWPMFEPRMPGILHIESPYPYRFVNKTPGVSDGVARPICSKRPFCARVPRRSPPSSPSRSRARAGSFRRRTTTSSAFARSAIPTRCC